MREHHDRFVAASAQVVAIGMGSAIRTAEFRQQMAIPYPLLSDPRRVAYKAYGLTQIKPQREANLTSLAHTARNLVQHGGAASSDQDMAQLGGVFIVDPAATIRYAFLPQLAHEFPPIDELLQVVATLLREATESDYQSAESVQA